MLDIVSRLLAVILVADGLATFIFGHRLIVWQRRVAPEWYQMALDALLDWPEPALRTAGVIELLLGLLWLKVLQRGAKDPAS